MASDAQRLTSEFAAGRLAAPHFFGAMLVSGENVVAACRPFCRVDNCDDAVAFVRRLATKSSAGSTAILALPRPCSRPPAPGTHALLVVLFMHPGFEFTSSQ